MSKNRESSIKNEDTYKALRSKGYSQSKAAAIANAQARDDMNPSRKGGKAPAYEKWSKDDLIERAGKLGISGRWDMTKDELIDALRD